MLHLQIITDFLPYLLLCLNIISVRPTLMAHGAPDPLGSIQSCLPVYRSTYYLLTNDMICLFIMLFM